MTIEHNDSDLPDLFRSLDREMERKRGREAPFDSQAVFHQLLAVRQSRRRRRHRVITGCATIFLLALGAIGLQMQSNAVDAPIAIQESPSTSKKPEGPTLAEMLANDPEYLAAQIAVAQEHQARLELMALRSQNAMNAPSFRIDTLLVAELHSKAWRSVEVPGIPDIPSGKSTVPDF